MPLPPWLIVWIVRFARGERWRKATAEDWRIGAPMFFLTPIYMGLGKTLGTRFMDTASPTALWLASTTFMIMYLVNVFFWTRFVPAKVSWMLAVIAWAALLDVAWHDFHKF